MPDTLRDNLTRNRHVHRLAETLRAMFRRQALEVASRVTLDGPVPELTHWVEPITQAAQPTLLRLTQQGIAETQVRLLRRGVRYNGEGDGVRRHALPVGAAFKSLRGWHVRKAADAKLAFDLFNPRVIDAVDEATFRFCRETMETARSDLADALAKLRRALRRGLKRGDAMRKLAEDVHRIFADPARAYRIAVTESSRAQHAGQLMAAKESGVVKKKSWVASSDACDLCLSIMERGPVGLDEPFYVDQKGGVYAVVHNPPAHPHCFL